MKQLNSDILVRALGQEKFDSIIKEYQSYSRRPKDFVPTKAMIQAWRDFCNDKITIQDIEIDFPHKNPYAIMMKTAKWLENNR